MDQLAAFMKKLTKDDDSSDDEGGASSTSELENILKFEKNANQYLDQKKYEEAYGIATKQYELGQKARLIPVLIKCYVSAMHTNRPAKAVQYRNEFFDLLQEIEIDPSPIMVEKYGTKCYQEKKYFEALLMFQLTLKQLENEVDMADTINILHRCCGKTSKVATKLVEKIGASKLLVKNHVIPLMEKMIARIKQFERFDRKEVAFVQAVCLHYLERCQFQVGNIDGREESLIKAIDLMKKHWGDDACKKHIYGGCLNNLGHTFLVKEKQKEASEMFKKAIAAKEKAEDYDTPEEQKADVEMSKRALEMSETNLESKD